MDGAEQIAAFEADMRALIHRYRSEFDLTLAAAIGTIECVKLELFLEQKEINDEDNE
jgi:hypothetical protein